MEDREIRNVLDVLDNAGIRYRMVSHDPVYTIEEMERLHLDADAEIAKNLFLRDARGKRHFLVVLCSGKAVDLKALRGQLGTSALSFASEDRLKRFLGLEKGAVTPLGILNDEARAVEVLFDRELAGLPSLGVHPNRHRLPGVLRSGIPDPQPRQFRFLRGHLNLGQLRFPPLPASLLVQRLSFRTLSPQSEKGASMGLVPPCSGKILLPRMLSLSLSLLHA